MRDSALGAAAGASTAGAEPKVGWSESSGSGTWADEEAGAILAPHSAQNLAVPEFSNPQVVQRMGEGEVKRKEYEQLLNSTMQNWFGPKHPHYNAFAAIEVLTQECRKPTMPF